MHHRTDKLKQLSTQFISTNWSNWSQLPSENLTEPKAELRGVCVTATVAVIAPVSFLLLLANCHAYFLCRVTAATQPTAWWITNPERESIISAWIKMLKCLYNHTEHLLFRQKLGGGLSAALPSDRINKETRGNSVTSVLPAVDRALWNQTFGFREV